MAETLSSSVWDVKAAAVIGMALAALCGCGDRPAQADAAQRDRVVHVVTDDFHSALVIGTGRDPWLSALFGDDRIVEIGFSEYAWAYLPEGDDLAHLLRLGLVPDAGIVEIFLVPDAVDIEMWTVGRRRLTIPVTTEEWRAICRRLDDWARWRSPVAALETRMAFLSEHRFSAYNSCNDFVADLLDSAGLAIGPRPWRCSAALLEQVEWALSLRGDARGSEDPTHAREALAGGGTRTVEDRPPRP